MDAYNNGLVTALTCEGCPPGSLVSADHAMLDDMMDSMGGDHLEKPAGPKMKTEDWYSCQYPGFISGDNCDVDLSHD